VVDADHEPRARIALMEEMQMAAVRERISRQRDGWLGAEFDRSAPYWDFTH
jgi:hypothetical protein